MHVLVNGRFLLQRVTGVQRFGREALGAIAREARGGIRITVAVPGASDYTPPAGVELHEDGARLPGALWQQLSLPLLMRRLGADVLWSPANVGPLCAPRHVVTIHDASPFLDEGWFSPAFTRYYRFMFRALGRRASAIATVSEFSRAELLRFGIARSDRIKVIYQGLSPAFTTGSKGSRGAGDARAPYILSVGSRDPRKDLGTVLRAWALLGAETRRGLRLLVVGGGADAFARERLGQVPEGVEFLGYVDDERLAELYRGALIMVFASLYEGFGLPPLEAMASGTPVIAARAGSLPEVLGDAPAYFAPGDAVALAGELELLIRGGGLRQEISERGLRRVERFSWARCARDYLRLFETVARGEKGMELPPCPMKGCGSSTPPENT